MKVKLTPAQRRVLAEIASGKPFCEYLTPDTDRLFFRTLGDRVHARLNYIIDGKRVAYKTFWMLFKMNLITPSAYKGSPSPQDGITQYYVSPRGYNVLHEMNVSYAKRPKFSHS